MTTPSLPAVATTWTTWPAPAKLNLFLHIIGRRADGYHLLQTAFQLLEWGDEVRLRIRKDGAIRRVDPLHGIADDDDLAVCAARVLQRASGTAFGADIAIGKNIPLGGGLGGGSSDAATTLVALNALWRSGLDVDALAEIGRGLGADVPLFVRGHNAWAEGIGEELTPIDLPPRWFVVVDSGARVPTIEAFGDPQLTRDAAPLTIPRFASGAPIGNVFEPVVRRRFPKISSAMEWLAGFGSARLTGSGGCVFAAFDSGEKAARVAAACPVGMRAFAVHGAARSPLLATLENWQRENA